MAGEPTFSIILHDMDVEGTFFKVYKHQYRVITQGATGAEENKTGWYEVEKEYFLRHENDLGMEIVTKNEEGKISKTAIPPGYGHYVGNSHYGEWRTHNGSSFWAFYGQYAFMTSMFNMMSRPVYRRDYDGYRSGGYYGSRPYYGSDNGKPKYGTQSAHARKTRPNFFQRKASRSGWSKSRSRSSGRFRSRGGSFGK